MRKPYFPFVVLMCAILLLAGCSNASQSGSLSLSMDLSALSSAASTRAITITQVNVALGREGYDPVTKALPVSNNQASGRIDGLAPGIWNLTVVVMQDTTELYNGSTDVTIIAGAVQECRILLDPAQETPTTGSVSIVVGVNPLPGYKQLNQAVSNTVVDQINAKLYVIDATTNKVGVYSLNTLERGQDLTLPQAPVSAALNSDASCMYLGYTTGQIYSLNLTTGQSALLLDVTVPAKHLMPFGSNYLLVADAASYNCNYKSIDVASRTIVDSAADSYAPHSLEYNAVDSTAYFHRINVSPSDLHRIRLDAATGDIVRFCDSIYHGDYTLGYPIRIINHGTRVVTSGGSMFTCSAADTQDLIFTGNIGYSYADLKSDDAAGYLYLLTSTKKLMVLNQENFFIKISVDLLGTPKQVFFSATHVLVLVENLGKYYIKSWSKADLGL